jgi:hypothetical protein
MSTYYGYVNRDQDKSVIDWAGVTKKISDDITQESKRRENLKFKLDQDQEKQLRKLDNYTQGLDKTGNQAAMEAAQGYRDFLMENHKLMKAGIMSVNDSKLVKENAKSTWKTLNAAFKGHQDAYKAKIEAGGEGNLLLAEKMAEMFDFQNRKIIPSKNGEAVFVNIDPDTGEIDMETAMPVSSLLNNQQQLWDTIDVQESASEAASKAAIFVKSPSSTMTISDARQNPEFVAWKENTTLAALDTPRRIASVLMDYLNVDSDEIKMVEDSKGIMQPKLTDDQIKKAKEAYGTALEISLGYSDSKTYIPRRVLSKTQTDTKNTIGIIDDFVVRGKYSGLKATLGQVASDIDLDGDILKVKLLDGRVKTVDLTRPQKDIGVEIAGIISPSIAGAYRNKGKGSLRSSVNPDVLISSIYTPISQKVNLSGSEIDSFNKALLPVADPLGGTKDRSDMQIKSAVTSVARKLNLDVNQVIVEDGVIKYGNTTLGNVGSVTGTEIAQKLEDQSRKKSELPQ